MHALLCRFRSPSSFLIFFQAKYTHHHELLRKYQSLQDANVLNHQTHQVEMEKQLVVVDAKIAKLLNAIAGLRIQHKSYDDVFDRVNTLANDILRE